MNTPDDPRSPYQPPAADLSQPHTELPKLAPHERSPAPKVFGVLSIIFSSIVLLFSTFGLLAGVAAGAAGHSTAAASSDVDRAAEVVGQKILAGFGIQSVILFVMSAVLLAIGIGQLRYRVWARRWSVYWGSAALVCVVVLAAISILIISPAYADLINSAAKAKPGAEALPGAMGDLSAWLGGTFAVMCVIFYTPYPAMMLLFFTRERVRASMTE
jgi:hypothetical protein